MSAPSAPPAPPRLSTTTDCFIDSLKRCATRRATTSVVPPAGNGTTMRIGLVGNSGAEAACERLQASAATGKQAAYNRILLAFMMVLPPKRWSGPLAPLRAFLRAALGTFPAGVYYNGAGIQSTRHSLGRFEYDDHVVDDKIVQVARRVRARLNPKHVVLRQHARVYEQDVALPPREDG